MWRRGCRSAVRALRLNLEDYLRRRRLRAGRPELSLASRLAFAATRPRYMRIISSDDAPSNMRALALKAASNFSATISLASRRALLSPRINFINRKPITRLASTPNIIHGWNIVFPKLRCVLTALYRTLEAVIS